MIFRTKYVEVCNTDAEGRLILADAMAYVQKKYELESMVDIATLTGAICVALGDIRLVSSVTMRRW